MRATKNHHEYVVFMMQRTDPNGDYDVEDLKQNPEVYEQILWDWYESYRQYGETVPGWLSFAARWIGAMIRTGDLGKQS